MSKKKSKIKFAFITLIAIIGIFLTCFSFRIPFTTTIFQGFGKSIPLGLDVKGGVLAVYEVSVDNETDFTSAYEQTVNQFGKILNSKGYAQVSISRQGDNRIRIEVPNEGANDVRDIFDILATDSEFKITKSGETDAVISGEHLKSAHASYQGGQWGVALVFTKQGKQLFSNLTSQAIGSSIDIYLGGEIVMSPDIQEAITDGSTFISGMGTEASAETYATKFLSSTFKGDLELISNQTVTSPLGVSARTLLLVAGLVTLVVAMAALVWLYGILGVIADFSMVLFTIMFAFFLQAVPLVEVTLAGVFGIVISFVLAFSGHFITFERIKEEYRYGKKIPASVVGGYKKSKLLNLDINIVVALFSMIIYFIGATALKSFGVVTFIGAILSLFTNLVMTKGMVNWYLAINSTKAKTYRLTREAHIDEI